MCAYVYTIYIWADVVPEHLRMKINHDQLMSVGTFEATVADDMPKVSMADSLGT